MILFVLWCTHICLLLFVFAYVYSWWPSDRVRMRLGEAARCEKTSSTVTKARAINFHRCQRKTFVAVHARRNRSRYYFAACDARCREASAIVAVRTIIRSSGTRYTPRPLVPELIGAMIPVTRPNYLPFFHFYSKLSELCKPIQDLALAYLGRVVKLIDLALLETLSHVT